MEGNRLCKVTGTMLYILFSFDIVFHSNGVEVLSQLWFCD